jgi:hypothetical protein
MKQCNQCGKEFEPVVYKGSEQTYCSKTCRTKAGNERYKMKLMTNGNNNTSIQNVAALPRPGSSERIESSQLIRQYDNRGGTNGINANTTTNVSELVRHIEQTYEAKTDAIKFELKYDNAMKEIEKLKQEIVDLELAMEEEPEPKGGFLGALDDLPEWLTPAIGKLLQSEKVQKFVISQIPEPQNQ